MKKLIDKERNPRKRLLQWAGTIITILALIFIAYQQGWGKIIAAFSQISIWYLCGGIFLMLCSRLSVTMRWYALLQAVEPKVPFGNLIRVTFAGLFSSNFLPTTIGGDVIRLAGIRQYSIDTVVGAASLIFDRLIGLFGMLIILPFAGSLTIKEIIEQLTYHPLLVYGSVGNINIKEVFGNIHKRIINALKACSMWYKHPIAILQAFCFNCLHMLCLFGTLYLFVRGLGDFLPLWKLGAFWSLVYFITLVPISINGYGLQEISVAFVLTRWGGMPSSHSITVALLIRMMFVVASLPGALFLPKIIADLDNWR